MLHRVLSVKWGEGAGATSSDALLGHVMGSCGLLLLHPSFAPLLILCRQVHLTMNILFYRVHHGHLASLVGRLRELCAYRLLHGP